MILSQRIGDAKTHSIPLSWLGLAFSPAAAYNLLFTLKADPDSEDDTAAAVQKVSDAGITVSGRTALVSLLPIDTAGGTVEDTYYAALSPGTYYWDIQAQAVADATDVRTVASGTLELLRDVGRGTETAVPVFIVNPGATYDTQIITYS